ncbi:MAG: acyl-CoA dehydrogenase [Candidatus Methanoliparum thermophilum]|uniref:Acyl-CoA dehydrogenase n=1 Tax=Methanoliparum thermophilum TaxID=2491083 RepID=A0A520KRS5_METT2|nr:acyl-CoA dehydrogenase family protein [Candidatus Methanoliparum sp. LAM-1]RZN64489.1 MAG: acyl-CoA dehydrogenase [Candidatus Methanoliparum thermophilum]BDC35921.1 acyl-CoA dehydrogenase [Candidatus Methanoliparum sp. LAM-1]
MDFDLSGDQKILQTSVREFLNKECSKDKVRELEEDERGYDIEMWKKMAELEWMGVVFPEEYGGTEGDFIDLMILVEEMGRYILPSPFFSTILSSLSILEYGDEGQKEKFLPKIAKGEEIWTLALMESSVTYEASGIKLRAIPEKEEYILEGTKLFVPYAHVADRLLVVARTSEEKNPKDGITVFIVDVAKTKGLEVEVIPTAAHDKQCEVRFDHVKVSKDNVLGDVGRGWDVVNFIIQRGAVLKCAEMVGGAQAVLEMANDYAKERVQFDRPIGSFQAIQHKLADMFTEIEGLRYLVYEAAWMINVGSPSDLLISMGKAKANEVYQRTCIEGIRIHGAIGFTREEDVGLYYLRTKAAEFAFGDTDSHRKQIAIELERS